MPWPLRHFKARPPCLENKHDQLRDLPRDRQVLLHKPQRDHATPVPFQVCPLSKWGVMRGATSLQQSVWQDSGHGSQGTFPREGQGGRWNMRSTEQGQNASSTLQSFTWGDDWTARWSSGIGWSPEKMDARVRAQLQPQHQPHRLTERYEKMYWNAWLIALTDLIYFCTNEHYNPSREWPFTINNPVPFL